MSSGEFDDFLRSVYSELGQDARIEGWTPVDIGPGSEPCAGAWFHAKPENNAHTPTVDLAGHEKAATGGRGAAAPCGPRLNLYTGHIPSKSVIPLFDTEQPPGPCIRVKVTDYGGGDFEAIAYLQEQPPVPPRSKERTNKTRSDMDPDHLARSVNRAKREVRQKCMMLKADRMLTFTYRENQQDRELAYRHLLKTTRRLGKMFTSGFDYVAVAERQKRGAWHFHLAVNRFYNVNILRKVWQQSTGDTGNVNVTSPRTGGAWNRAKLSRYLSKYMTKDQENQLINSKRYSSSRGIPSPVVNTYFIPAGPNTLRFLVSFIRELSGKQIERIREVPLGTRSGTWLTTF